MKETEFRRIPDTTGVGRIFRGSASKTYRGKNVRTVTGLTNQSLRSSLAPLFLVPLFVDSLGAEGERTEE